MPRYRPQHRTSHSQPARSGVRVVVGAVVLAALVGGGGAYAHFAGILGTSSRPTPTSSLPATTGTTAPAPTTTAPAPVQVSPPFVSAEAASWVAAENDKPGTRDWQLTKPATDHQIEGYASAVSVNLGDPVQLFVSTTAATFRIQAFRMGWYGGAQGRLVWDRAGVTGSQQPACDHDATTRMVSCSWHNPVDVTTAGWPAGDYLLKLQASSGWESYVPLTVRDDSSRSAYLVNSSVTTWQAYNTYGGYDLYQGSNGTLATRATAVSFDRPYVLGDGAGDFLGLELPMISMMESHALDVSYSTDVDLAADPALLLQHKAFVTLGHDEYYSLSMRQGLIAARDGGVNLVFLGANAVYRHIRLGPSALGPGRVEIDYKDAAADPLSGRDDADVTPWAWRDPPNNAPESAILGEMWQCNPVHDDMVITQPDSWMFAGTGFTDGSRIPGIVGPEYDHFSPYVPNPGNVTVVAVSPVRCDGHDETADMTYYSAPSLAGVWDTGTIDWVGQVAGSCRTCAPPNPVTIITANVLAAFGQGRAGRDHPSVANLGGAPAGSATTSPSQTTLPENVGND